MEIDNPVRLVSLKNQDDERGFSFSINEKWKKFLESIDDLHITTLKPGYMRGNHYHIKRREVLIIIYNDVWSFYWDSGPKTDANKKQIKGKGAFYIEIKANSSHAIKNDGQYDLNIIGISNGKYNPDKPDAYHRNVIK